MSILDRFNRKKVPTDLNKVPLTVSEAFKPMKKSEGSFIDKAELETLARFNSYSKVEQQVQDAAWEAYLEKFTVEESFRECFRFFETNYRYQWQAVTVDTIPEPVEGEPLKVLAACYDMDSPAYNKFLYGRLVADEYSDGRKCVCCVFGTDDEYVLCDVTHYLKQVE